MRSEAAGNKWKAGGRAAGSPLKPGLKYTLVILSVLAAVKMIFFGFNLDEEYQVVMAYRNAMGDTLFLDMWEPHQSSAFLCTLLMKPYLGLFGTTGIVLYLKVCGTLIHLGVSLYFYRVMGGLLQKEYAWLLALVYFNTIPKQIMLPEFGIMQVWFYTLLSLFLIKYYMGGRKAGYLVSAGISMALLVLAYPSCLILFPFVLALLFVCSGKERLRDMGILALACGLCGAGYLGMLLRHSTPQELAVTLSHILGGDVTHSLALGDKALLSLRDLLYLAALWAGICLLSALIGKWRKLDGGKISCLAVMLACGVELVYWVALNSGYETMQIHLAAVMMAGAASARSMGRHSAKESAHERSAGREGGADREGSADRESSAGREGSADREGGMAVALLRYGIGGAALLLLAVVYLTDLSLMVSIPHAMPAAFFGMALLLMNLEREACPCARGSGTAVRPQDKRAEYRKGDSSKWAYAVLAVWCLTAVFGKGYTLRAGVGYNNVLQSGGIMREGPAAGTISSYMSAYIYNCDYEEWQELVQDGDRVLIMVDEVMNLGTIQYLFKDVEISHFSVVNPTAYDERLSEYWEMYPGKSPNVIIVDCWYGQLMTDADGWMMRYIENDFGYTQAEDGRYIRVYRR